MWLMCLFIISLNLELIYNNQYRIFNIQNLRIPQLETWNLKLETN